VDQYNESILGTGFWFLGEEVHSPVDIRGDEADRFDNRIDVFSKTFLALTVSCARCHDHKFDAISTKDYYALIGFLRSSSYRQARFETMEHNRKVAVELAAARARHRVAIQKAIVESFRTGVVEAADYLSAAQDNLRDGSPVDATAANRKLDQKRLQRWIDWAKTAKEPPDATKGTQIDVVIDYATARPEDWMPDDVSFGRGPVQAGELRFDGTVEKPALRFAERTAAEKDPPWSHLGPTPDSQLDHGTLGSWVRPGRTLRTPTFPLTSGKLFYLVRGRGRVFAAVDSHTTVAGPLHGRVFSAFNTGDQYQWVGHDLSAYSGQRIHLEFSWESGNDLALVKVVQTERSPPDSHPNVSPSGLPKRLAEVLDRLAKDEMTRAPDAEMCAQLANWLLANADLFGVRVRSFAPVVKLAYDEQAKIIATIRAESQVAPAMWDGSGEDEHVFVRGSHKALGELAPRRFLEALAGPNGITARNGSGRLELARQMTDPAINPLLARVMVNRVWHHLFGRGIVASTDNFGAMGEPPTHPELLDYLADRFVKEGWSIKKLIRALVLSQTYRQSSIGVAKADTVDSENLLLHRARLRRLQGEAIRDAMLSAAGRLNEKMYCPPVPVYLTEFLDGRGRPAASGPLDGDGRRSVYIAIRRNFLAPMMLAFDTPSPFSTVGRRTVSNVPAQALILMNDPFVHQQAERWGRRIAAEDGTTDDKIGRMYETAFARPPRPEELAKARAFMDSANDWGELAHVLFNVKEFIYLP
jgi:hypothetical protein